MKMKKMMGHSLPIVGGTQMGHMHLTPKNHASNGIIATMPMSTNMSKVMARRMSAKRPAMQQMQGK